MAAQREGATTEPIGLDEAHLALLDHLGEDVHVGIMLPGDVPWAGTYGALGHSAHHLMDLARGSEDHFYFSAGARKRNRHWAEMILEERDQSGRFTVADFVLPLTAEHVVAVQRLTEGEYLALDFTVGTEEAPSVTVRVTLSHPGARAD